MKPFFGTILITDSIPNPPFREDTPTEMSFIRGNNESKSSQSVWTFEKDNRTALFAIKPKEENGWVTTELRFDDEFYKNVSIKTRCYGYWAIYIDDNMNTLATTCISVQPTWMNDMRDHIRQFRFCNLFIIGSHDSGSYRLDYNPNHHETIVTKYSITQVLLAK